MSIILRVDGLLGNMNGTVYGEQVNLIIAIAPSLKSPTAAATELGQGAGPCILRKPIYLSPLGAAYGVRKWSLFFNFIRNIAF
jgi:hypothetical protein